MGWQASVAGTARLCGLPLRKVRAIRPSRCLSIRSSLRTQGRLEQQTSLALRYSPASSCAAGSFKKYAVLAGINEPKKSCHGVLKARAEVEAYADCTESQMMAMFGWTDAKMPAHHIAQAHRERLRISGMERIVTFDRSPSADDLVPVADANNARTPRRNAVVTSPGNIQKNVNDFKGESEFMVRSEGLEPPRCYPLPPQGSASTNSATSAKDVGWNPKAPPHRGGHVTNHGCRDKALDA